MSQTRWHKWFKSTVYGPNRPDSPVREITSLGETGAHDLVAHEMRHYLRQRPKLAEKFPGNRITFRQSFDPFTELRDTPRIFIYLSAVVPEERPTAVALETVTVYVALLADQTQIEDIGDGEATAITVLDEIRTALRTTKARVLCVWYGNRERQMAIDNSFGTARLMRQPVQIGNADRVMELHEIPVVYQLHRDKNTGQIINLQAA